MNGVIKFKDIRELAIFLSVFNGTQIFEVEGLTLTFTGGY